MSYNFNEITAINLVMAHSILTRKSASCSTGEGGAQTLLSVAQAFESICTSTESLCRLGLTDKEAIAGAIDRMNAENKWLARSQDN